MNNLVAEHFDFRAPFTASNKNYSIRFDCCMWTETIIMFLIIMSYARVYVMYYKGGGGVYLPYWSCS